jgi:hypothetical protein
MEKPIQDNQISDVVDFVSAPVNGVRPWLSLFAVLLAFLSLAELILVVTSAADTVTMLTSLYGCVLGFLVAGLLWTAADDVRAATASGEPLRLRMFMTRIRWLILIAWLQIPISIVLFVVTALFFGND